VPYARELDIGTKLKVHGLNCKTWLVGA